MIGRSEDEVSSVQGLGPMRDERTDTGSLAERRATCGVVCNVRVKEKERRFEPFPVVKITVHIETDRSPFRPEPALFGDNQMIPSVSVSLTAR